MLTLFRFLPVQTGFEQAKSNGDRMNIHQQDIHGQAEKAGRKLLGSRCINGSIGIFSESSDWMLGDRSTLGQLPGARLALLVQ